MSDVIVIANQKRTIAVDGGEIPCTFDPLDGNAGKWVEKQPCVANWMTIEIYPAGALGTPTNMAYRFRPSGVLYLSGTDSDGSGESEISQDQNSFPYIISVPVWKRKVRSIGTSVEMLWSGAGPVDWSVYIGPVKGTTSIEIDWGSGFGDRLVFQVDIEESGNILTDFAIQNVI